MFIQSIEPIDKGRTMLTTVNLCERCYRQIFTKSPLGFFCSDFELSICDKCQCWNAFTVEAEVEEKNVRF